MKTILTMDAFGNYELTLVNQKLVKQFKKATGNESILFQTDWDFPGLARCLGWSMRCGKRCRHSFTDGTIDCPDCGLKAWQFIDAAREWLDNHNGQVFNKGCEYFGL